MRALGLTALIGCTNTGGFEFATECEALCTGDGAVQADSCVDQPAGDEIDACLARCEEELTGASLTCAQCVLDSSVPAEVRSGDTCVGEREVGIDCGDDIALCWSVSTQLDCASACE